MWCTYGFTSSHYPLCLLTELCIFWCGAQSLAPASPYLFSTSVFFTPGTPCIRLCLCSTDSFSSHPHLSSSTHLTTPWILFWRRKETQSALNGCDLGKQNHIWHSFPQLWPAKKKTAFANRPVPTMEQCNSVCVSHSYFSNVLVVYCRFTADVPELTDVCVCVCVYVYNY